QAPTTNAVCLLHRRPRTYLGRPPELMATRPTEVLRRPTLMETNLARQLLEETNDFEGARYLVDVEGMSSAKICSFLNALVARMDDEEHYLEVGTWRGRTLLSAAYQNRGRTCFACDKFRILGRWTGWGFKAKRQLMRNIERYRLECANVRFFHMTSRRFF